MENVPEGTRKHKLPGKRKREQIRIQIGLNHLQNGSVATENEEKLTKIEREKNDGKKHKNYEYNNIFILFSIIIV